MSGIEAFVAGLPKAELHVHHVGSASPAVVSALAARYEGATSVPTDPQELAKYFEFTDFAHFIQVYLSVVDLIRDAADVRALTYGVAEDMARQNIRYAELTVTPYSSVHRGIPGEAFMEAIEDARKAAESELGVVLRWCFDIPGEATGPQTVWDALRVLGAERIGHGTTSMQDPRLVDYLGEHRIPLEVCPTSNIATRVVDRIEDHPIRQMVDAGLFVTINSDDPPMFGTDLNREYAVAAGLLGLDESGVAELARQGVRASFLDDAGKSAIIREIDAYLAGWPSA